MIVDRITMFTYADNSNIEICYQSFDIEGTEIDEKNISNDEFLEILNDRKFYIYSVTNRTPNTMPYTCNGLDLEVVYLLERKK